jgi:LuxR family transcriptional regulator, quorum-sensing system regulator BjaR1
MPELRPLTRREIEVLALLAQGNSAKRIGHILGITPRTVSAHTQSIISKLGTFNCTHAVAIAVRDGLIRP